jgi:hypothetical protein
MRRLLSQLLVLISVAAVACADAPTRNAATLPDVRGDSLREPQGIAAAPAQPAAPVRVARPEHVKAIYLNAWAAGSTKKLGKLIDIADKTEINAFVIDVKEAGEISYQSKVKLAREIGAAKEYIRNASRLLDTLRAHNIYPIARIVVFKDPVLAEAKPEFAVKQKDGTVWKDNKGKAWVDTYNKAVWDYNIELAREAIELGFAEVQWDYIRFTDAPMSYRARAVYPAANGRTRQAAVREFMLYSKQKLADLNVPITADVFGLTVSTKGDMGIGQEWEQMVDAVDVILPMVYPSHYIPGNYGLSAPNAYPYRVIYRSMQDAIERSKPFAKPAIIRPWLQAFTLGPPKYGPAHVRAQIQAVYEVGLDEWVLWSPGSNYDMAALAPEGGPDPVFDIPGGKGTPSAPKPKIVEKKDTARVYEGKAPPPVLPDTSSRTF